MIGDGTKTSETKSDKFEVEIKDNLERFFQSQGKPLDSLSVSRYEGTDTKFYSDIKVTNPQNGINVWIEVKKDKYACLGGPSMKYRDGKWECTTTDDEHIAQFYVDAITRGAEKFVQFCKSYLKTEDIRLPKDLSPELISAWKKSGSVDDTDNDVQFITDKIPLEGFGDIIAEYYKTAKHEPVYYIQVGDDLYIVDPRYNPLGLKTKDGGDLKPFSDAYRLGRIQFRAKGLDKKLKDGKKYYYSIVCDVKILADDENKDETPYECSLKSDYKFPIIENSNQEKNGVNESMELEYEPPYTLEQIRDKYDNETYNRLASDPIHRWRAESGIELIHREPTQDEFERIWKNWQKMPDDMKRKSDEKSLQMFGLTNKQNYEKILGSYGVKNESRTLFENGVRVILEDWMPEYDNKPVNQWGERWFEIPKNDAMFEIVNDFVKDCCSDPDLEHMPDTIRLSSLHRVEDGHYIATVFGGCNGGCDPRKTIVYLAVVKKFAKKLLDEFGDVWLVDWSNDCCDDVWTVRIAFRDENEEEYAEIEKVYDAMFGKQEEDGDVEAVQNPETVGPELAVDILAELTGGTALHEAVRGFMVHSLQIRNDIYRFVVVRKMGKNLVVYKNDEQGEFFAFDNNLGKKEFLDQATDFLKKIVCLSEEKTPDARYVEKISQLEVREILDTVDSSTNPRYNKENFTKYLDSGGGDQEYVGMFSGGGRCLALAVLHHDYPERGYCFILEVQRFEKGYGEQLIINIVANHTKVWLGADPTAEASLVEFYRRPSFGFNEFVVENSAYGVPLHIFYTRDCDKDTIESFVRGTYQKKDYQVSESEIGGEKSDTVPAAGKKIWIDDIRQAPDGFIWIRSVDDFIDWCYNNNGIDDVSLIDTDHDAGEFQSQGGDYIRCFDYLESCGCSNVLVHIHSANPVGANNIRRIISKNKENGWREIRNS